MNLYAQLFTVTGSGAFPLDMLRYDGCYPHAQQDVSNIEGREPRRSVTLRRLTVGKKDPEFERWTSFLWSVDRASIQTVKVVPR